jgi:hypothetical protein
MEISIILTLCACSLVIFISGGITGILMTKGKYIFNTKENLNYIENKFHDLKDEIIRTNQFYTNNTSTLKFKVEELLKTIEENQPNDTIEVMGKDYKIKKGDIKTEIFKDKTYVSMKDNK